jgi:hypothetical protein
LKVYAEVSQAFIEDDTEGSVLYFIHKTKKGDKVLSLSKLKTLEYRIYRKLREKLRNYISNYRKNKGDYGRLMKMMMKQTRELCRDYRPPMPFEFYFEIANLSFEFAQQYPRK